MVWFKYFFATDPAVAGRIKLQTPSSIEVAQTAMSAVSPTAQSAGPAQASGLRYGRPAVCATSTELGTPWSLALGIWSFPQGVSPFLENFRLDR
jgi:hypothetical protein